MPRIRKPDANPAAEDPLALFHPAVGTWFRASFPGPTRAQKLGWPPIARGESTLILAPTGSGKTLAAFMWAIERLMFAAVPAKRERCRILYVSPLKALAVDVERNLRAPIAGIASEAEKGGAPYALPSVWIRTGDTPAAERAHFARQSADILITTPESLYLLLTSNAREALRSIDTVIVDEIHSLVPTKRGAHLALSLERLEALRDRREHPLQRIGLSATQRPLDEVARFLGGAKSPSRARETTYRPVALVNAAETKRFDLRVEVPVEDMARVGELESLGDGAALERRSIWAAMHPKLVELVRQHRSTLIFVNGRRLAERIAAALNELAGEPLVRAHHGSLAREQRIDIEERLKSGTLRGLVATSSLELGIDMGAIDLVIQIESPPSVAAGIQRIGRGGHQAGAVSSGIIFPKFRGDLVASAAAARAIEEGRVEATQYPRHPLDVLAQQLVAMAALDEWPVEKLFSTVRRAAPFTTLSRATFERVLDMLAGRYPSDDFSELRPRITWDRATNTIVAREGARRIAVMNGGTIPDRGLYGVFLAGAERGSARVGELDEEMVFESRAGETFLLGASTWRIEEITHDRVLVSPAPGEPGKMPFWHGDRPGRPLEFGRAIGGLVRAVREMPPPAAIARLTRDHKLDRNAAENLVRYLADQAAAAGAVPDDETVVIERYRDELGDWRVCVMSPFGSRVHAPWSMAATAQVRASRRDGGLVDPETLWTDDGFVIRFPDTDDPPDASVLVPEARDVEALVTRQLGATALFAAKFREIAARALLLPRMRVGGRTPLWQQRKRATDLLAVAAHFPSFPMLLETYRECLSDAFDMRGLEEILAAIARRSIRVVTVDSTTPSPFAASLLFGYVANYIYDGDAPLAERRAQALTVDPAQLHELLGDVDFRELLDRRALEETEREAGALDERHRVKTADALHDLLLRLGDLAEPEIAQRCEGSRAKELIAALVRAGRALAMRIAGEPRYIAVEDAARYRDAVGIALPSGIPAAFLDPVIDATGDLVRRYARTHGPFTLEDLATRWGITPAAAASELARLTAAGKLVAGEFRGFHPEWCDAEMLRRVRQRSLAQLRREIEPVEARAFVRLITHWQGVVKPRRGLDALLDAVGNLQGAAIPASILETDVLPARVENYRPGDLDTLMAAGEVVWCGVEPLGDRDGRVALYLADHLNRLWEPRELPKPSENDPRQVMSSDRALRVLEFLKAKGASFFVPIHEAAGGGYPGETTEALWDLAWRGLVTNDTFAAVRARTERASKSERRVAPDGRAFRSRRLASPATQGRWSLIDSRLSTSISLTERLKARAEQMLARYGVLAREAVAAEGFKGGFSALYPVLKALEESGRIRRGMFVAGLGATQFALPAALDLLRSLREQPEAPEALCLAAADPANPHGTVLAWPAVEDGTRTLARSVGAMVILVDGELAAYFRRGNPELEVFLPEAEPGRSRLARALAEALREFATQEHQVRHGRGLLVGQVNGRASASHSLALFLEAAGFALGTRGYHLPRRPAAVPGISPVGGGF